MTYAPTPTYDRPGGRAADELRPVTFTPGFIRNAHGSVLVEMAGTRIICTATVQEKVPRWMEGSGTGWVTAEYSMLPASTGQRKQRDRGGKVDGRSVEIQRLIGRSLRAVVDFAALGERMVTVDCDVIDADGGTRCASICGGWVALKLALDPLVADGLVREDPLTDVVSAVSVGVVSGMPRLDLEYVEDAAADVDMNLVITGRGELVEVQASAEGATFPRAQFDELLDLATGGCSRIAELQQAVTLLRT
jgi:ribonuclease PH